MHSRRHRHKHHSHGSGHAGGGYAGSKASPQSKKTAAILFLVFLVLLLVLMWAFLREAEHLIAVQGNARSETEEEMTEPVIRREVQGKVKLNGTVYTYDHVIESWLVIGTDGSGNEANAEEEYHGGMADFLALAVFDKTDKTYALLQLNRDTMTNVKLMQADGSGNASADMQVCMAHWYGGNPEMSCENTVDAVSRLLGKVKIDGYYCLGMEDIGTLNHAVGGVEVTVTDDFSKQDPTLKEGETVLLDDEQAVSFVRGRMSVGDGSNVGRMNRQKEYLKGFLEKVKEKTREKSSFLNDLYRQLEEAAVTTMTARNLSRLAKRVDQGRNLGTFEIEGIVTRGYTKTDKKYHAEFYPDKESLLEVMTQLYHLQEKQ